jgi:signal recognition particle subunit SRP68
VYQKLREFTQTTGELTHILDMLVQSVGDILSIPSLSELEPLRAAKYSAYQATFRAVRAATIAQSYQQQRRFAEAMSLYQYAAGFLGEADEILSVHPASKDDVLQEFGKSLGEELGGAVSRTTAQSFLQQSTASEPDVRSQLEELELSDAKSKSKSKAKATVPKTRKSLLERQDEFAAGSAKAQFEVVKLPPAFQAVPSKPMLFDVAFNELEMPDITERTKTEEEKQAEAAEAAKQASSGGLFGWFRK